MRILIIATMRSGGYYFTKSLSDTYQLQLIHEPEYKKEFDKLASLDNVCIKLYLEHMTEYCNNETSLNRVDRIQAICTHIRKLNFDKVFILDRRNSTEHVEACISLVYHVKHRRIRWNANDKEFKTIRDREWSKMSLLLKKVSAGLDEISAELGITKIYYEDLYYNTEIVDLQGLEFKPDTSKKLRLDLDNKLTLI